MNKSQRKPSEADSPFAVLNRLRRDRLITPFQHGYLVGIWPELEAEWTANPYLREIPSHTAAIIDASAHARRR